MSTFREKSPGVPTHKHVSQWEKHQLVKGTNPDPALICTIFLKYFYEFFLSLKNDVNVPYLQKVPNQQQKLCLYLEGH
jgi:hypothetical protein